MGKKINWNSAEDQTLTRVWLSASDLQVHGGEKKPPHFWTMVYDLFHQESGRERPLTGLKVRWTRINRDSQKFAAIFNDLQRKHTKHTEESDDKDSDAVALLKEQQWIEEANGAFHRHYHCKFLFEACWKQLRYSPKWLQLCNITNISHPVVVIKSADFSKAEEYTSGEVTEQEVTITDSAAHTTTTDSAAAEVSTESTAAPDSVSDTSTVAAAQASALNESSVSTVPTGSHVCQANASTDAPIETPNSQLQGLTTTLVGELKRQNDLMEDQNAIALLTVDGEMIPDAEARHCYQLLRARYLKRIRTSSHDNSNGYSSSNDRSSSTFV